MQTITTIGLDIAKSVFQVHGVDAEGKVIIRRQLKRRYVLAFFRKQAPCLVGIEACASSHHWSRELKALGHTVRLMPPAWSGWLPHTGAVRLKRPERGACRKKRRRIRAKSTAKMTVAPQRQSSQRQNRHCSRCPAVSFITRSGFFMFMQSFLRLNLWK